MWIEILTNCKQRQAKSVSALNPPEAGVGVAGVEGHVAVGHVFPRYEGGESADGVAARTVRAIPGA